MRDDWKVGLGGLTRGSFVVLQYRIKLQIQPTATIRYHGSNQTRYSDNPSPKAPHVDVRSIIRAKIIPIDTAPRSGPTIEQDKERHRPRKGIGNTSTRSYSQQSELGQTATSRRTWHWLRLLLSVVAPNPPSTAGCAPSAGAT